MADLPPIPEPTGTASAAPPKPKKKWRDYPLWVRWAAVVGAVLLAFFLQSWWSGRQKEGIRRDLVARFTKALVYASPVPSRRDPDTTRQWCAGLAKAGGFERVTFTDVDGRVLASTDRSLDGTLLKDAKSKFLPDPPTRPMRFARNPKNRR